MLLFLPLLKTDLVLALFYTLEKC